MDLRAKYMASSQDTSTLFENRKKECVRNNAAPRQGVPCQEAALTPVTLILHMQGYNHSLELEQFYYALTNSNRQNPGNMGNTNIFVFVGYRTF